MDQLEPFTDGFRRLTTHEPMEWQKRLFIEHFIRSDLPSSLDLPTGLGKTSVMAIWYLARRARASLPRRLVYVVDRRAVVDQASTVAAEIKERSGDCRLRVSTLRGQHVDNREWLEDPASPAIVVGTVDMIGSRLLFSGYGVSRKMRPYHAGLLGSDTLVVLDEAHLVPPFERLLEAIESGSEIFGPREEADRKIVPALKVLSLSATGRDRKGKIFRLTEEDLKDSVVKKRLGAKKRLTTALVDSRELDKSLAHHAWALSNKGTKPGRYLVYCDSRRTAEKVRAGIEKLANATKVLIDTELLVGARRVRERVDAAEKLKSLGFLAGGDLHIEKPLFLVATSAGEVGIDLDADHMVCDLVPWERMVQRLGRVNRRGDGDAQIVLLHEEEEPKPKKPAEPTPQELRAAIAWRSLNVFDVLPRNERGIDVNPGALRNLKLQAGENSELKQMIETATSSAPLRPKLTRALADAWAMTSLEQHTGRPDIVPWLRGWTDDEPQTSVVWRSHLPTRSSGSHVRCEEIEGYFDAAPPHLSEKLETESWHVVDWLMLRALAALKAGHVKANETIAFALTAGHDLKKSYLLRDLVKSENDKKRDERLAGEFSGVTLVVDVRLGGLTRYGTLKPDYDASPHIADDESAWSEVAFRVRESGDTTPPSGEGWHESFRFDLERSEDGESLRWLVVEGLNEERRAESANPQMLDEHHSCTEEKVRALAKDVGLPDIYVDLLALSARLHDEGKRALRWQQAFNAPRDGFYAKTKGPLNLARLNGYRHEFGSLPYAEADEEFKHFSPQSQDLVLHLIAAHHGRARPVIETEGCEDAPPSLLEERAREVALRFARLQKRWGPWGLAWFEALLRASDQQASRDNDRKGNTNGGH